MRVHRHILDLGRVNAEPRRVQLLELSGRQTKGPHGDGVGAGQARHTAARALRRIYTRIYEHAVAQCITSDDSRASGFLAVVPTSLNIEEEKEAIGYQAAAKRAADNIPLQLWARLSRCVVEETIGCGAGSAVIPARIAMKII